MTSNAVVNPVKIRLSEDHDRNKLSIGERYWIENDDKTTPRKGIIIKGRTYVVDAADRVVKHFIDGGTLEVVKELSGDKENSNVGNTFEELVKELDYVGDALAGKIVSDFTTYKDFKDNVDIEYLKGLNGVGASKAEEILSAVKGDD